MEYNHTKDNYKINLKIETDGNLNIAVYDETTKKAYNDIFDYFLKMNMTTENMFNMIKSGLENKNYITTTISFDTCDDNEILLILNVNHDYIKFNEIFRLSTDDIINDAKSKLNLIHQKCEILKNNRALNILFKKEINEKEMIIDNNLDKLKKITLANEIFNIQ
jgi:hypothetical protein